MGMERWETEKHLDWDVFMWGYEQVGKAGEQGYGA